MKSGPKVLQAVGLAVGSAGRSLLGSGCDDRSLDQKATVKVRTKGRKVGSDRAQINIDNTTLVLSVKAGSASSKDGFEGGGGAAPDVPFGFGGNIKHRDDTRCYS